MFLKNKIKKIESREILDSRGNPTLEVKLETSNFLVKTSVPSGASKGRYEAKELRDGEERFDGKGVLKAVKNVNEIIAPKLKNMDPRKQKEIDQILIELDGTSDKRNLGANTILGVSMVVCKAGARTEKLDLYRYIKNYFLTNFCNQDDALQQNKIPLPCFNVINGGVHANSKLDIQEFLIIPQRDDFQENLQIAAEVYHQLKKDLKGKFGFYATNIGDEGGFVPKIEKTREVLDVILRAINNKGYLDDFKLGIDCAATQFFKENKYYFEEQEIDKEELLKFYQDLVKEYPVILIEDPFAEDDFQAFNEMMEILGNKIYIFGDDLTVTNPERVRLAKERNCCNGMIIKPNQIGTITETLEVIKIARSFNWKILVSHRSGETCDDFIADLAVGVIADFVKFGAPARGERIIKYNRLLDIYRQISSV
jgi:enolase